MSARVSGAIRFECAGSEEWDAYGRRWTGEVKVAVRSTDMAELIIYGKGSCMNAVVGRYMNGQYICISDLDTGCPLSRLTDTFWNRERISGHMPEVDAITIAYALKAVSEYLGGGWL